MKSCRLTFTQLFESFHLINFNGCYITTTKKSVRMNETDQKSNDDKNDQKQVNISHEMVNQLIHAEN